MGKPIRDLTGQTFGRWTAIKMVDKPADASQTGAYWLFRCKCGTEKVKAGTGVSNKGGSCGCLKREVNSKAMKEMQLKVHGTLEDRFYRRFTREVSGCWEWVSHRDKDGYGILPANGPAIRAHRFSFEHFNKTKIDQGMVVCHSCDNPSCVNPEHLFLGTVKDNCQDMISKGRDAMIGSKNNKSKLTESDIPKIRNSKLHNSAIAMEYGVSESTIKRVKNKTLWRHVK